MLAIIKNKMSAADLARACAPCFKTTENLFLKIYQSANFHALFRFFLTNQTKLCTNVVKHTAMIHIYIFFSIIIYSTINPYFVYIMFILSSPCECCVVFSISVWFKCPAKRTPPEHKLTVTKIFVHSRILFKSAPNMKWKLSTVITFWVKHFKKWGVGRSFQHIYSFCWKETFICTFACILRNWRCNTVKKIREQRLFLTLNHSKLRGFSLVGKEVQCHTKAL